MHKKNKTLVVGLDAATWSKIRPLITKNDLPNLENLIQNGVSGDLVSTTPPMTPLAWNSIVTGVNPGKHGIYDFVKQDRESYKVTPIVSDGVELGVPAIWDLFNQQNKKVGVMNFPLYYPPPENDPFFISGISSPENWDFIYPPELKKKLQKKDYRIHPKFGAQNNHPEKYIQEVEKLTQIQLEVALDLLKNYDLDMFWAVFMGIDWIQHYLWNETINREKAVNRIYRFMDKMVGKLLGATGSEWDVLVLSDHGFSEIYGEINLNNLLEKWGYLKRKEQDVSPLRKIQNIVFKNGKDLAKKFPLPVKQKIRNYLPEAVESQLKQIEGGQTTLHKSINWKNTKAFSYGYMGRVYIHTQSDYPKGTIKDDDYQPIREEIIQRLKTLETPEGEKVIKEVFRKEELYHGKNIDSAPDILFNPTNFSYMFYGDFGEDWYQTPKSRVADHDDTGIFILKGDNIKEGIELDANLLDITPTLIYANGFPVLNNMDGRVLEGAFKEGYLEDHPIKFEELNGFFKDFEKESTKNKDEEDEVISKLEDLGYL